MNEKTCKALKSIEKSIKNINKQVEIIRIEFPEANIYVENGENFNIMKGETHTNDSAGFSLQENVIDCFNLLHADCGGW